MIWFAATSFAQNIEFGVMAGGSNYMGDVSEQSMHLNQTNFSAFGRFGEFKNNKIYVKLCNLCEKRVK